MGTQGMKPSLVRREVIADSIELVGSGHMFDAMVTIVGCFFFQAEDGIRDHCVTGVQTCALPIFHTAFSMGRIEENSIVRMRPVLERVVAWLPEWEEEMSYGDVRGVANVGAIRGGFGWRVSRTPHATDLFVDLRVPPDVPMADARRRALEFARGLEGVEAEVYVTAPGAEIDEDSPVVGAVAEAHEEVFGSAPERDVTRWFSDASVLSRYGIATLNYGTSSGLPDAELGENLEIDGLVKTAEVYARAAQKVCG